MSAAKQQMQEEIFTPSELKYLEVLLDRKQFSELEQCCQSMLRKAPSTLALRHLLGLALAGQKKYSQAIENFEAFLEIRPDYVDSLVNLAIAYEKTEQFDKAIETWSSVIAAGAGNGEIHSRLGQLQAQADQWEDAVQHFIAATELNPENASYHHKLGVSYNNIQQFENALDSFLKSIELKPMVSKVHHDAGLVLRSMGRTEAALGSVKRAVEISPLNVNSLVDLGGLYLIRGDFDSGFDCYQKALSIVPDNAAALGGLGAAYNKRGDHVDAIKCFQKAYERNPNMHWVKINFAETLSIYPAFPDVTPEFLQMIIDCLEDPAVESAPLCGVSIRLLYQSLKPNFYSEPLIYPHAESSHFKIYELLLAHLSNALLPNPELEDYMVRVRRVLLSGYLSGKSFSDTEKKILHALALQGDMNEFIWFQTSDEEREAGRLGELIDKEIEQGGEPDEGLLYLLGSYVRINQHDHIRKWAVELSENACSPELFDYLKIAVLAREQEKDIAKDIHVLTPIEDGISNAVRSQYEENPYPCWKSASINQSRPYIEKIATETFPNLLSVDRIVDNPRVLIAGCGTGKHVLQSASGYKNASIMAIDLSKASLAYAARKAREYGIDSITFAQADILQLGELDETFDIIECGGVLHHMENPEKGLQQLLPLLKPDGFLKLGLYSELARKEVVSLRQQVDVSTISTDISQLRSFRRNLRYSHPEIHEFLTRVDDFSAASSLRDLLLHVQEHRFTIPQLKTLLDNNQLEFLGFAFRDFKVKKSYRECCPDDPLCLDLSKWDVYEQQHPRTFGAMYQFWCSKKSA